MTQAIFKYDISQIGLNSSAQFEMPIGATPLCVQLQRGFPVLWVLCDPAKPKEMRGVYALPTGVHDDHTPQVTPDAYVGTYQTMGGALVTHIFMD